MGHGLTTDLPVHGARTYPLTTHTDDRGAFTEVFRQTSVPPGAPAMVQSNLSVSRAGVLRGLHFHRRQADYWCVLEGSAFVALYDLRRGSPSEGVVWTDTFDAGVELRGLYVPPGVAHGFCALTALRMQYMVDAYFTGEDEFGIAWNDPEVAVPWPVADPVLSERDASAPGLASLLDRPAFGG